MFFGFFRAILHRIFHKCDFAKNNFSAQEFFLHKMRVNRENFI